MSLKRLLPNWYTGVTEFNVLMEVEDDSFNLLQREINKAKENQWIVTADEQTIAHHETIFNIIANPLNETLTFRRQRLLNRLQSTPPFTVKYLIDRLNQTFGSQNYTLIIDYENYQMLIETAAENANWFNEVQAIIHKIKPANLIYIQIPAITQQIKVTEKAMINELAYFRVGRSRVGRDPLLKVLEDKEVILK